MSSSGINGALLLQKTLSVSKNCVLNTHSVPDKFS